MSKFGAVIIFALAFMACQNEEKKAEEIEDCPTIALDCPEGQIPCDIETDNDPCAEVVLGEEPCTQIRTCMPE